MSSNKLTQSEFAELCANVMKIVNKHHQNLKNEVACYRKEVKRLKETQWLFHIKIERAFGSFNEEHRTLPNRLDEIKHLIGQHAIGVQNVYNEFNDFKDKNNIEKSD